MKDNKRAKVLLKMIPRIDDKNSEIQEMVAVSMIEVCAEEEVSSEQVFSYFPFSLLLSLS